MELGFIGKFGEEMFPGGGAARRSDSAKLKKVKMTLVDQIVLWIIVAFLISSLNLSRRINKISHRVPIRQSLVLERDLLSGMLQG
jgi:hypothetical protein